MSTDTRSRRLHGDEGAVLVEFALALPFLALVVFGIAEFTLAWRAETRLDSATASSGRVAAAAATLTTADRAALVSVKASLPSELLATLDRVVIYKASAADGKVPTACVPAVGSTSDVGVTNSCNSYSGNTVRAVTQASMTGFGGTSGMKDAYWAPSARLNTITGPPDYVGIYVRTTYNNRTATFWKNIQLTDSSVFRIQPDFTGL